MPQPWRTVRVLYQDNSLGETVFGKRGSSLRLGTVYDILDIR